MSRAAEVTLLIPGLAGPPDHGNGSAEQAAALLLGDTGAPGLARLAGRGEPLTAPGDTHSLAGMLFEAVGLERRDGADWPAAAVSRQGSDGDAAGAVWMRADPVYLRPDMGRLVLFAPPALDLTLDEAQRIAAWINGHEHNPGLVLEPARATCWHLRLDALPRMTCVPPCAAHGHDADASVPRGPDAAAWHARMNELQMLLHQCPVNDERERNAQLPVNSVWFWGAGTLPGRLPLRFDTVFGDHDLVPGLASLGGGRCGAQPASAHALLDACGPGTHLVALDRLELLAHGGDVGAWCAAFATLERDWLAPLSRALVRGRIARLEVRAGGGAGFVTTRRGVRRWWRRIAPATRALASLRQHGAP